MIFLLISIFISSNLLCIYYKVSKDAEEYYIPLAYLSIFISILIGFSLDEMWYSLLPLIYGILILKIVTAGVKVNSSDQIVGWLGRERNNKMDDGHYLKYFNSFDSNYKVREEIESIKKSAMFGDGGSPHWAVTVAECPSYKGIFSSFFQGRSPLSAHDLAHLLIGRGFNLVDEIAVVAIVMGSTKKVGFGRTLFYYIWQWLFYPKWLKLPMRYFGLFYSYVKYGTLIKKNLSRVKVKELKESLTITELRDELGIYRDELLPHLKTEVLEYGVNSRLIIGMNLSQSEIAMIEHSADSIVIFSRELKGDLTDYDLIYSVSNNLMSGKTYKWICPDSTENRNRKSQLLELHNDEALASIVLIDKDLYESKFSKYEEYVSYNNRVRMGKIADDNWIVVD